MEILVAPKIVLKFKNFRNSYLEFSNISLLISSFHIISFSVLLK